MLILILVLVLTSSLGSTPLFAHSTVQIIEMTSEGFTPQEITIDENSSVIFINKDTVDRWPASNVHPTHDLYPQFDPQKPVEPGASWVFKPSKVGLWKYHDHLKPHLRAILIVEKEAGISATNINWFENIKSLFLNFSNKIRSIFEKKEDPALVWNNLKEKYKGQAGSSGNIHDLAHLAGGLLFEKMGFAGLGKCSVDFAFGCYHGFLDSAFAKNLDHLLEAQDACLKLGPAGSGPVGSCIHGIGHGVASFHSTADLKASLADCRKLTSGKEFCFDGVFMEFVRSAGDSFYRSDQPLYPCDSLEKEYGYAYSLACGRNQPSLLMGRFKMSVEQVTAVCLNSSSKIFKQACFDSIGFSLASGSVDQITRGCQAIGVEEYVITCAKSAAGELIFQEVPGWSENSVTICKTLPPQGQKECFDHINRIISDYGRRK